jgi:hypothetical protein
MFVVTGDGGGLQEIGKTTLVELLAGVFGGAFRVRLDGASYGENVAKQITSIAAMRHRVVMLDNTTGVLRSSELADLITSDTIDGRPAFGRQTRRKNLLTWCVTTNDLAMSTDLASRAVVIRLAAPDRDAAPEWEATVARYVEDYRDRVIADTLAALRGARHQITGKRRRFTGWCREVLGLDPRVDEILPALQAGIEEADADADEVAQFLAELRKRAGTIKGGRFPTTLLCEVWNVANHDKLTTGWVIRRLKAAKTRGRLPQIEPESTHHGCDWVATTEFWQ